MKKLLILLILLFSSHPAFAANETIAGFAPQTSIGTADLVPFWQTSTGTTSNITEALFSSSVFSGGLSAINSICSLSGMPATCGAFFGFVLPQWYGGFCDSNWNANNNVHDDSTAIATAMQSGYPVYIYHCKIASTVQYSANDQIIMSFSNIVPYDLTATAQPFPGAIFVPNNLSSTAENCAIDFNGWNSIGLYGINMKANNQGNGSAGICGAHGARGPSPSDGLTFTDVEYFSAQNMGMGFGGATDNTGVPQVGSSPFTSGCPSSSSISYGCNIQIQMHHFIMAHDYWGMRGNWSDDRFSDFGMQSVNVAIASFEQFTGGATFTDGRIEDNFVAIPTGTSAIYPANSVNGLVSVGAFALWNFINTQFTVSVSPEIDIEGGNATFTGGYLTVTGNGGAANPVDCHIYINPATGGNITMAGYVVTTTSGHPAYGLCGGSTASNISVTGSYGTFGATGNLNLSSPPATLNFDFSGPTNRQYIGGNTGINIGTAAPLSTYDMGGNVAIGTGYAGVTAAPLNGAIIRGNVGIGTANPLAKLNVTGLGTTSPGAGGGYACVDSNGDFYIKSSCP